MVTKKTNQSKDKYQQKASTRTAKKRTTTGKTKTTRMRTTPKKRSMKWSPAYIVFAVLAVVVAFMFVFMLLIEPAKEEQEAEEQLHNKEMIFIKSLVPEAKRIQKDSNILPSITIAQAILESNWGESELAAKYNNLFGVKGTGPEDSRYLDTKEYVDGKWIEVKAYFREYPDWKTSMQEHANLFLNGTTWNPNQYEKVLQAKNYKEAAHGLKASGYATDPDYPQKLIDIIEMYHLDQYDQVW